MCFIANKDLGSVCLNPPCHCVILLGSVTSCINEFHDLAVHSFDGKMCNWLTSSTARLKQKLLPTHSSPIIDGGFEDLHLQPSQRAQVNQPPLTEFQETGSRGPISQSCPTHKRGARWLPAANSWHIRPSAQRCLSGAQVAVVRVLTEHCSARRGTSPRAVPPAGAAPCSHRTRDPSLTHPAMAGGPEPR